MSVRFAISSLAEARAYLEHDVLGPRLRECVLALNELEDLSAEEVLGTVDAQKFHSCLTLFAQAASSEQVLVKALEKFYGGELDRATLSILHRLRVGDHGA